MAQTSVTIKINSEQKKQFAELCNKLGMSANTAINIFVEESVRLHDFPKEIKKFISEDYVKKADAHLDKPWNKGVLGKSV